MNAEKAWKDRVGFEWDKDSYIADVLCMNGCGHMGERQIFIKKGVRRDEIDDLKCHICGCNAVAR